MSKRSERTNSNGEHPATSPVVAHHDWRGDEPLGATVVEAVSEFAGDRGTALPPLQDCVDADALDALFAPNDRDAPAVDGHLVFSYDGMEVKVYTTGVVVVRALPGAIDR
jgi:hypothetical protein